MGCVHTDLSRHMEELARLGIVWNGSEDVDHLPDFQRRVVRRALAHQASASHGLPPRLKPFPRAPSSPCISLEIPWRHASRREGGEAVCFLYDELVAPPNIFALDDPKPRRQLEMREAMRHITAHHGLLLGVGLLSGTMMAWHGNTLQPAWEWRHPDGMGICALAWSDAPNTIGALSANGQCHILCLTNGLYATATYAKTLVGLLNPHILRDGKHLVARDAIHWHVWVMDLDGGARRRIWPVEDAISSRLFCNAFAVRVDPASGEADVILLCNRGEVARCRVSTGAVLASYTQPTHALTGAISARLVTCSRYVAICENMRVRIHDVTTLQPICQLPMDHIGTLQFHPSGQWLATCRYARSSSTETTHVNVWLDFWAG